MPVLRPVLEPVLRSVFDPAIGGGSQPFTAYVDSVNGSDANDGLTAATALQTLAAGLAAVAAEGDGAKLGLARGSHWREELALFPWSDVSVVGYGDPNLPLPKIDCSDIADSADFSATGGYAGVYDIDWTHQLVGSAPFTARWMRAWEDGDRLKWVSSVALCEAEAGTFHCPDQGALTNPVTIYIHPSDNGDPASNGKVYEFGSRNAALHVGPGYRVSDVHTTRNCHKDGSFMSYGYAGQATRVLATDGIIHNLWVGPGSTATGCVAYDCEPSTWRPGTGATLFITHRDDSSALTTRYIDCAAYTPHDASVHLPLYAHTSGGANRLAAVEVSGFRTYAPGEIGASDTDALTVTNTFIEHPPARAADTRSVSAAGGLTNVDNVTVLNAARMFVGADSLRVKDLRAYTNADNSAGPFWHADTQVENSTFVFDPALSDGQSMMFIYWAGGSATKFSDCAVEDAGLGAIHAVAADSIESDGNVWWRADAAINNFVVAGAENSFAAWQSTTGQDGNSVSLANQSNRLFPGAHLGDFTAADGVVDADGRQSGSRLHIDRPDWAALVARWKAGFIG